MSEAWEILERQRARIVNDARTFVGLAIQHPYDWPDEMDADLLAAYDALKAAVVAEFDLPEDSAE